MVKCFVWSILLYEVQAWTLQEQLPINKIETFEMRIQPRTLRVFWVDPVRYENIVRRAGVAERELLQNVKKRKVAYLGRIMRWERYHFQRLILQGQFEEVRRGMRRKNILAKNYLSLDADKGFLSNTKCRN